MSGGELLVISIVRMALLALPGIAASLFALRRGVRDVPVLLAIGIAATGVGAILCFWAYYATPRLGTLCTYALYFGAIAMIIACWPQVRQRPEILRQLGVPLALWALGTFFLVFLGFLHGGAESPLAMAATRFSGQLPSDNDIPHFYGEFFFEHGHSLATPIFPPDWLFSDRGPLQVGYMLSERSFGWDAMTLRYQVLGVALQQLWIVGLWGLLTAARVTARTRALAAVAVLVSDVAIVHGFFVWPKLLCAAFVLAAFALVVRPGTPTFRSQQLTVALAGILVGLAYLAHPSALFAFVPLVLIAARRGLPGPRWWLVGALCALLLVAPWVAYQRLVDPPANRLAKWKLAGVAEVDGRGTVETVRDSYSALGLGGALGHKAENFLTMLGGGPDGVVPKTGGIPYRSAFVDVGDAVTSVGDGHFGDAAASIREARFSHLLWSLGLLAPGLVLIAIGRLRGPVRGEDWRFARICLFVVLAAALVWGLVFFGSVRSRTIVSEGALAVPIVGMAGIVAGLHATFPRWATWLVGANVVTTLILYVPALTPLPGTSYSLFSAVAVAASLAATVFVAFRADAAGPTAPFRSG